jgi:hypothetical protein
MKHAFLTAPSPFLDRCVDGASHATSVYWGFPRSTGLNVQDKYTQFRVVFVFTFRRQPAWSSARVWLLQGTAMGAIGHPTAALAEAGIIKL